MSYADEASKAAQVLAKQGKAFITINLVAYANDMDFEKNRPSCRVTITVRDPGEGNRILQTVTADIQTTTPPYSHKFEIKVQTTVKSLGRFIGLPQHRSLSIDIRAEPIGGYEKWYEADASIGGLTIEAGSNVERNVSLKPTYEESRLNQPTILKKPRLGAPEPKP